MAFGDITRIATNVPMLEALNAFQQTNALLAKHQLRLSTGSRLNSAEDDSAGYSIASSLRGQVRGQAQALSNIGDAKNMLTVAEGSLDTIQEILQTMKEKATQAANDTLSSTERTAIDTQMTALSAEITDILSDAKFNTTSLFTSSAFSFQVGDNAADSFSVTVGTMSVAQLGIASGDIDVSTAALATAMISTLDSAITTISNKVGSIGDSQSRLSFKEDNLTVAMTNTEAALSRIADADFAKEQVEIAKLQILQQTGVAAIAQANASTQAVLSLL